MSTSVRVAKNSLWLIAQPVLLNLLSLFAIAYIARVLGKVDYGKFVIAFAFVGMFTPLANMGLRALTVRQIAEDRTAAAQYAGKMLGSRCVLALATMAVIAVAVHLTSYDPATKAVVYLASLTLLTQTISSTWQDVFQGFESMGFVAYSQFIGGFVLTVLSIVVLFFGFGLTGLTLTYVFGSLLTMVAAWAYARRLIGKPALQVDWHFLRRNLASAAPFFYPTLVAAVGFRAGTILLSFISGAAAVGVYGAATSLVGKLEIISDGICTAIFPTLVVLYQRSPDEAGRLFRRFFDYLIIIGLPIAVGTTIVAEPIVLLLFGKEFVGTVPVLRVLIWWMALNFLAALQSWTLGAIHQERKGAVVSFVTAPLYFIFNLILIPFYRELGAAWANLFSVIGSFALLRFFIRRHLVAELATWPKLLRLLGANLGMGALVYLVKDFNLVVPILIGATSYPLLCLGLGVFRLAELVQLRSLLQEKGPPASGPVSEF